MQINWVSGYLCMNPIKPILTQSSIGSKWKLHAQIFRLGCLGNQVIGGPLMSLKQIDLFFFFL